MFTVDDIMKWRELPPRLAGMKATVLGLARSGRSAAELLNAAGCQVFASDSARNNTIAEAAAALSRHGIKVEIGRHTKRTLACDFLVRSPGIPSSNWVLEEAQQRRIPILSEIELAAWFCQAPIIAVTGSNGKTTTVAWLGDTCRRAGRHAVVCGNMGFPFSKAVSQLKGSSVAIVELSSFQLENIIRFSPDIAVIINFSPDHLDRYRSYDAYLQAKCRIFANLDSQAVLVYNRDDREVVQRVRSAPGRKYSFGFDFPEVSGVGLKHNSIVISNGSEARRLLAVNQIVLPGRHNLENALAVICASVLLEIPDEAISSSLQNFAGVPHRLEVVLEKNDILWVNDSKATNIASGLVALESFQRPIILLAGGREKGDDFGAIAERVAAKARKVILFGEAAATMAQAWSSVVPVVRTKSLAEATSRAAQTAKPGDVILLAPMCASFDEFSNYEERGDKFKYWVSKNVITHTTKSHIGF